MSRSERGAGQHQRWTPGTCEQRRVAEGQGARSREEPAPSCREGPWAWEMSPREVTTVLPLNHLVLDGKEAE